MRNIIFFTQFGKTGPSSRFRVFQFEDQLKRNNIEYKISPGIKDWLMKIIFPPHGLKKIVYFLLPVLKRLFQIPFLWKYDIIVIQKPFIPGIFPFIEIILSRMYKKTIFDIDDALWIHPANRKENAFKFLKSDNQTELIFKFVSAVACGNKYIYDYAKKYNNSCYIVPTSVHPGWYKSKINYKVSQIPVLGWIGTESTVHYIKNIINALEAVYKEVKFQLVIIGGDLQLKTNFPKKIIKWKLEEEAGHLINFDIGLMPMTDDARTKGKCGAKLLQYMVSGIPSIASPVGVTSDIIQHGVNGFLVEDKQSWTKHILRLLKSEDLRKKIGIEGRKAILKSYSTEITYKIWEKIFKDIYE